VNAFIIGAGFTKAVIPTSPLNSDLLDTLAKRKPSDSAAPVLRDRYKTDDIEIALTRLDCDIAQGAPESSADDNLLRQRIETELGDYFSSFSASEELMAQSPWLTHLVDDAFKSRDIVISLNYDCVLEGLLDCRGKWSPNCGYGCYFNHPLVCNDGFKKSAVAVLKIHGSASFTNTPIQNKPGASTLDFVFNERFFPRSAKNIDFGSARAKGPYLIAPSYVKVPKLKITYLMLDALAASTNANNLIIIGSALRPEDGILRLIVTHFLRQPSWQKRKIIIVDPSATSIGDRIKDYWVVNVSNQIVPIQAPLQDSVADLLKRIESNSVRGA
jgi:hypothetical protein